MPFSYLPAIDGSRIAYHRLTGKRPGIIFCGGFKSDMEGTKALYLEALCAAEQRSFLRFDYFAHGKSDGAFTLGTIGHWLNDTLTVLDALTEGPQIIVGSSMGGWIMLLAALARRERIHGLVGIAAAPDFTERLMWKLWSDEIRQSLLRDGIYLEPSAYSADPYPITLKLIEEGRNHLLLDQPIQLNCPVRLLQGMADEDVPWSHALILTEALGHKDVTLTLIKDGDHRLSRPQDLALLKNTIKGLLRDL